MAMEENDRMVPLQCTLYGVNIPELLLKPELYRRYIQLLSDITAGNINTERLKLMASNSRNMLYVLLVPQENLNENELTIYSVIQGCLEGRLEGVPELCSDMAEEKVSLCFQWMRGLPELFGLKIVNVYALTEGYEHDAIKLLTRYCNGDAAGDSDVLVPQLEGSIFIQLQRRSWPVTHYLGVVFDEPNVFKYNRWDSNGLSVPFVEKLQDKVVCVMLKLLSDYDTHVGPLQKVRYQFDIPILYRRRLVTGLTEELRSLDPSFALRVLKMPEGYRPPPLKTKIWNTELSARFVLAFIEGRHKMVFIPDLQAVAKLYFGGELQISLSEDEKLLLLLEGLHDRTDAAEIMYISEDENLESWRRIFDIALDYINGQFPEVVDE